MERKLYIVNGKPHSVSELCRMSGLSRHYIQIRLDAGWSAEKAISTPVLAHGDALAENFGKERLKVKFTKPVPGVLPAMQPQMDVPYIAVPSKNGNSPKCRMYYVVMIERNKPLIVYPGEFQVIDRAYC